MAEIEIHHGHHAPEDPLARRVGIMVGVIGVALAVVTIASHREHTHAVLRRTEANDLWGYYQAKKIREHTTEVGNQLLKALGTDAARTEEAAAKFEAAKSKYAHDAEGIWNDAKSKEDETEHVERLALRYDLGEGFLELGLVLTSLFFLGRQRLFPFAGGIAAVAGAVIAASALLL